MDLSRAGQGDANDWVDAGGRTYDAVGNFPSKFFDSQWPNLQVRIVDHLEKAEIVPVDVSQFAATQREVVREFVQGLGNPNVVIIGGGVVSGFVRFVDGDWSWNSSMTRIMFDLLEDRLPDGDRKAEIVELRDNNVLMLDLRDPSQDQLVAIIANELNDYLAGRFDADARKVLERGYSELLRLAAAQHRRNTEQDGGGPTIA
ncbi:hypothetical protein KL864_04015 [Mycolicibacterium goodii]|uniref:hypothetical protein n=1 Tax=Mycolicibacterium goodii TaxID=134601 RepID=UPI001BDBEA1B|nr:hypothetical protein [Mycolicibacterium goodii]